MRLTFSDSGKAAAVFPLATAALIIYGLADWHFSRRSTFELLGIASIATISGGIRTIFGGKIGKRGLYADVVVALLAVTALEVIGSSAHESFGVLYFWIALYAGLYFRPRIASIYLVGIAISYFVALLLSGPVQGRGFSWVSIVATALIEGIVAMALVAELKIRIHLDSVSRLPNRFSWDERLDIEFARAKKLALPLSVAIIDVDDFKSVNDREGHQAGDRLLLDLANGWRKEIRSGDFLARFGGDEFGLVAPGSTGEDLLGVIDRIKKVNPQGVTCSIGVVTWDGSESKADLVRRADEAMYAMKRERHNPKP